MPDFFFHLFLDKPFWMWGVFFVIVAALLAFDLGVVHRKPGALSVKQSLRMSGFYISVAMLFSLFVWHALGAQAARDYLTGYIVEETLSMDNIFVMSLIFGYFHIPRDQQYRVLFYGILGVVILRGIMIAVGSHIVHEFEWALYVFGMFLVFTGVKMLLQKDHDPDIGNNLILRIMRKFVRMTPEMHGQKFFVRKPDALGRVRLYATPLFAALLVVEFVDLIFAVDSVPAIFAITDDTYVVYTSNIFAILGLRALYFALSAMIHRFEYLKFSLAAVLIFIGSKIFIADFLGLEKFPSSISLSVTVGLLAAGIFYSLYKTRKQA
jgi:tellurite resistance protein TerC